MQFNSLAFALSFAAFYPLYVVTCRRHQVQNLLLLAASYAFYAAWDWRFLSLLVATTLVDYFIARALQRFDAQQFSEPNYLLARRRLVTLSVVSNLGVLGAFKYYDFFATSFATLLGRLGLGTSLPLLELVLPLGISFYTFQSLGYVIDVYRGRQRRADSLASFALYVAFFPQLVAGPIERASHLLPQIEQPRTIDAAQCSAGLWLLVWGYFKKLLVADEAGAITNYVFHYHRSLEGADLVLGVLAFAVQIYADFSAYTDMARGLGKLMGFELTRNFHLPYLAASPREFWQRWHVTLSTWLADYVYQPLGGSRGSRWQTCRNLLFTMLLGGFWHGARWSFLWWGAFHGTLLVGQRLGRWWFGGASLPRAISVPLTFVLVCFGWLLFRAQDGEEILYFVEHAGVATSKVTKLLGTRLATVAAPLVLVHALQASTGELLLPERLRVGLRAPLYALMLLTILIYADRQPSDFLYFQF